MNKFESGLICFNQEKHHMPWLNCLIVPCISTVSNTDRGNGLILSAGLFLTQTARLWLVLTAQFNLLRSFVWMYVNMHLDLYEDPEEEWQIYEWQTMYKQASLTDAFWRSLHLHIADCNFPEQSVAWLAWGPSHLSPNCLVLPGRISQY